MLFISYSLNLMIYTIHAQDKLWRPWKEVMGYPESLFVKERIRLSSMKCIFFYDSRKQMYNGYL